MSDDAAQQGQASGATGVFVPPAIRASHPEIIDLILHSESMNDEERQYWIDILPVMTPDQTQQLRSILTNERDQLAAIDAKYAANRTSESTEETHRPIEEIGTERRERASKRSGQEQESEEAEAQAEEEILRRVEDL